MKKEESTTTKELKMETRFPGSLRDYFAGQVLAGLSSNTNAFMNTNSKTIADICYSQADEMLKARES